MAAEVERLSGEEALHAAADLLYYKLRGLPRLERFFRGSGTRDLAVQLRRFLAEAFDGEEWPSVVVDEELFSGTLEPLADLLLEALNQPLPLGEDPIVGAFSTVIEEKLEDDRVAVFYEHLRDAATPPDRIESVEDDTQAYEESSSPRMRRETSGAPSELVPESICSEQVPEDVPAEEVHNEEVTNPEVVQVFEWEINTQSLEELVLPPVVHSETVSAWQHFLTGTTREAAGEAVYSALFEAAPSLKALFKTPRAIMAMRFMNGLCAIAGSLHDPKNLKSIVETLGFQHLELDVTIPRIVIFRDALLDLLETELGPRFTPPARQGWAAIMNYAGGAYVHIRVKFQDRIKIINSSWATANNLTQEQQKDEDEEGGGEQAGEGEEAAAEEGLALEAAKQADGAPGSVQQSKEDLAGKKKGSKLLWRILAGGQEHKDRKDHKDHKATQQHGGSASFEAKGEKTSKSGSGSFGSFERGASFENTAVPTTYNEMFQFNAAVMGFAGSQWMSEVLASFDAIVRNVSNSGRLQEECDVLSLRMGKYKGPVNLADYKSVMLASLRSLVPKDWNSQHEVAWSWLWENVEKMLKANLGKPAIQERALGRLWQTIDEYQLSQIRSNVYTTFFTLAPAGQEYFKQSTTRLHFIADRLVAYTLEMYREPTKMVEELSALGLRHVGYGIPTELFGPFVTACIEVLRTVSKDHEAEEAFRWSLGLIARILVRAINEGSTIVMKAINANSARQVRKAVSCAPRGKRSTWVLNVTVGSQCISPLVWAIESGSQEAAHAIIVDLLTIRADRDRYYYGCDELFERHPDIIKRLCSEARTLLPVLLDRLIWRSRLTENGQRRANYYVKHLIVDEHGKFSPTLEWIAQAQDPEIVCHPVISLVTDMVWSGVAYKFFLVRKLWFLLTLAVFVVSQSILLDMGHSEASRGGRIIHMLLRAFIYVFSMGHILVYHVRRLGTSFWTGDVMKFGLVRVPRYLQEWQDTVTLLLLFFLVLMLSHEPILYCLGAHSAWLFDDSCEAVLPDIRFRYCIFSSIATVLYYVQLMDLGVFSTKVSSYVLVCTYVMAEAGLFLLALAFAILAFASGLTALGQENQDFEHIPASALSLLQMFLRMYHGEAYDLLFEEPCLLTGVIIFLLGTLIFLVKLLIAQLNCSYEVMYANMVGYARLNRMKIIVETMPSVSESQWKKFLASMKLDERLEFNEGDIGMPGGIQTMEPAAQHVVTEDIILRYGGSTKPGLPWPEENSIAENAEDRFERMERIIQKAMKKMSRHRKGKAGSSLGSSFLSSQASSSSASYSRQKTAPSEYSGAGSDAGSL